MPLVIQEETVKDAYIEVMRCLLSNGRPVPCQGKPTVEMLDAMICIRNPIFNIIDWPQRKFNYRYMIGEALWNLCPRADVRLLQALSSGIVKFVADQPEDTRHLAAWAYGPQIAPEIMPTMELLSQHSESRRAIWRPGSKTSVGQRGVGTPPCLELVQFHVRDGRLNMTVFMRSNDAYLGMPYDMFTYTFWQAAMALALGVEIGGYVHHVGSLHMYVHDRAKAEELVYQHVSGAVPRRLMLRVNLRDIGECSLHMTRDLNRAIQILECQTSKTAAENYGQNWWESASFAPLLDIVAKCMTTNNVETTLADMRAFGIGVGW